MNKDLIIRVLGKENAIKFDDEMYNLRGMVEELRHFIILQLQLSDNEANHFKEKLLLTSITMNLLSQKLDSVTGYTNSKNYLKKVIGGIYLHTNEICSALSTNNFKNLTYHTNCLADLVLAY